MAEAHIKMDLNLESATCGRIFKSVDKSLPINEIKYSLDIKGDALILCQHISVFFFSFYKYGFVIFCKKLSRNIQHTLQVSTNTEILN